MKRLIFLFIAYIGLLISCQEKKLEPLLKNNGEADILDVVSVENLHGGAKIIYNLPDDPDISYVMAEYVIRGEKRTVKSSKYKNFVVLEGFKNTSKYEVNLYTVTRSEKRSEPVSVTIEPLKPPIYYIFHSLKVNNTFGGIDISFYNEAEDEYVLHTLMKDSTNTWVEYDRLYTSAKERDYAIHGLAAEPTEFAFFFMDRWQNYSDTLYKTLTPLYEEELDKSLWKLYPLDNDTYAPRWDRPIEHIWDGSLTSQPYGIDPSKASLPQWFTIDLGQAAIFSRFRFNEYFKDQSSHRQWAFGGGSPKEYEIWGSNNPSKDGSWDSWTLLGKIESIKPSGLPPLQLTNEDIAAVIHGEDYTFPYTGKAYRYIRFKTLSTWGGTSALMFAEMTLWGQPQ